MHHQVPHGCQPPMHHPPHPLLSNQLQPINPETHTSMWLDDPYSVSNTACPSQRDSGFNSRPASLRSLDSSGPNSMHHGSVQYEQMPQTLPPNPHENVHPQYAEMQTVPPPVPPPKPDPNQVIPELLSLLIEDDPVIVREAILVTHMLIKEGGESRSEVIRNREVINVIPIESHKNTRNGNIDLLFSCSISILVHQCIAGYILERYRRRKDYSCISESLP